MNMSVIFERGYVSGLPGGFFIDGAAVSCRAVQGLPPEVSYVDTPNAKILNFWRTSLELATRRELTTNLVHTVTFTLGIWNRMTINRRK